MLYVSPILVAECVLKRFHTAEYVIKFSVSPPSLSSFLLLDSTSNNKRFSPAIACSLFLRVGNTVIRLVYTYDIYRVLNDHSIVLKSHLDILILNTSKCVLSRAHKF